MGTKRLKNGVFSKGWILVKRVFQALFPWLFSADDSWPVLPLVPFDPAVFLGSGWTFWLGPLDGDGLSGEIDEDPREKELTEFDTARLRLACPVEKDKPIDGGEYLARLKKYRCIRLGPREFLALWNEPFEKTLKRLRREESIFCIYFFVPLRDPDGDRRILCLDFDGTRWLWDYSPLNCTRYCSDLSVVLEP